MLGNGNGNGNGNACSMFFVGLGVAWIVFTLCFGTGCTIEHPVEVTLEEIVLVVPEGGLETEIIVNLDGLDGLDGLGERVEEDFGYYSVELLQTRTAFRRDGDGIIEYAYVQMYGSVTARQDIRLVDFYIEARSLDGGDIYAISAGVNSIWNSFPSKLSAGDVATFTVTLTGPPTEALFQGFSYDITGVEYALD